MGFSSLKIDSQDQPIAGRHTGSTVTRKPIRKRLQRNGGKKIKYEFVFRWFKTHLLPPGWFRSVRENGGAASVNMALSQVLDDSPLRSDPKQAGAEDLYNERHRLALEELLSGGSDCFLDFLRKEKLPNFLSDDEIRQIRTAAVSLHGEDPGLEQSLSSSVDCSSLTYFPDVSDLEPPLLELGWPAFTAGSYRGVTRAVAHFQPGYGECIYGCKEAARRLIKSAREVPKSHKGMNIFSNVTPLVKAHDNRAVD